MPFPIVITPEGGSAYRVKVADGSEGLSHSNGLVVAGAESVLNIVSGLLGETTLDAEGKPWGPVYEQMLERLRR